MSLHDAFYAMSELAEGRRPDSRRALDGLHALIVSSPRLSDPALKVAADALQQFVVSGDFLRFRSDPAREELLAAVQRALLQS